MALSRPSNLKTSYGAKHFCEDLCIKEQVQTTSQQKNSSTSTSTSTIIILGYNPWLAKILKFKYNYLSTLKYRLSIIFSDIYV